MEISYRPMGNRIIVKPIEDRQEKKWNSLIIPDTADHLMIGEVVKVGKGEYAQNTGVLIPTELKEGCVVMYLKAVAHTPLIFDNVQYLLMREGDVELFSDPT